MSVPVMQAAVNAGEISPQLFGRIDLDKYRKGCSTLRNMFPSYRGGAFSRAGTMYVGQCKQAASASSTPPQLIPFQFNVNQGYAIEAGDNYMRFVTDGAYITEAPINVTAISNANPGVVTAANSYSNGDWVFLANTTGMPRLDDNIYVVAGATTTSFTLKSTLTGAAIDTTTFGSYGGGATAARIYTVVTPYAASDLPLLKWNQSADVMTLTHQSYKPADLERINNANWSLITTSFSASIAAPTGVSVVASNTTASMATTYAYIVTAVNANGEESVGSAPGTVSNSVDIAVVSGTHTVSWGAVGGAQYYNIFQAPAAYSTSIPSGVVYGFVGSATGTSFINTNITPDYTVAPPQGNNPFASNNNPGVSAYFQQRRVYASTVNDPDTYYMSRPGAFTNMDFAIPTGDDDAITGTPWAQQVNGISYMVPMPNGLVILTGLGAWQLSSGTTSAAVTPANQNAQPQAYNGCNPQVRPITINYDILYVQAMGSIVRDLAYNFFVNIYTGTDLTVLSNHLFDGHKILRWDWAEEPYKLIWAVREDGVLLSLTYLKEQDVYAWARHDTNGLFQSVCVITEPPVNAPYFVVKRLIQNHGSPVWAYFLERMDNRIWNTIEECWCLDAALALPQPEPNASLTASSATGTPTLTQPNIVVSGSFYSTSTFASIVDPTGVGATLTLGFNAGGNITSAALGGTITGYTNPVVKIVDPTGRGSGGQISLGVQYTASFTASGAVFTNASVGQVIRMGGGIATVLTSTTSTTTSVIANITQDITAVIPNDPLNTPIPAASGGWTITAPVQDIFGLDYLEGMTVGIFADGSPLTTASVNQGQVVLPKPASQVLVGLPFTAQLQTLYLDVPGAVTVQTRRKNIYKVSLRVQASAPPQVGINQPDASVQPNNATVAWGSGSYGTMNTPNLPGITVSPGQEVQLFTGDIPTDVEAEWNAAGQVAVQQTLPVPLNLLALVPWGVVGDDADE